MPKAEQFAKLPLWNFPIYLHSHERKFERIERTFKTQNPCPSDHSEAAAVAPFEMATLKSKAFKQTKKERQEEMKDIDMGLEQDTKSKRRSSLRGKK